MQLRPASQNTHGFSLTEVLITLFVLAMASTAIVATQPKRTKAIDAEARKFGKVIDGLSDAAVASGQLQGIKLGATGYDTMVRNGDLWTVRKAFKGGAYDMRSGAGEARASVDGLPDIVADPTGIVTPRTVDLTRNGEVRHLIIRPNGKVETEPHDG